jgi:hypothetical protein
MHLETILHCLDSHEDGEIHWLNSVYRGEAGQSAFWLCAEHSLVTAITGNGK